MKKEHFIDILGLFTNVTLAIIATTTAEAAIASGETPTGAIFGTFNINVYCRLFENLLVLNLSAAAIKQ